MIPAMAHTPKLSSKLLNPDRKYGWMQAAFLEEEKKWVDVNCR